MVWSRPENDRAGRPFLLALHGHNGDENQLAVSAQILPAEMVIVSPRAPFLEAGGWSWFELSEQGRDAAALVATELLAWLDRQTGYSSYGLLGLSQGSAMALELMKRAPARFDYVVQLSGFAIDTSDDAELARVRPPVFSAHGDLDTVIPADRVLDTARWLHEHTTLTQKRYSDLGHNVSPREMLDVASFVDERIAASRV